MYYGNRIAELRKKQNLTQSELGAMLNITAQAVSKWENNLSEPDLDSIKKMCHIFGVSVDEFLNFEKPSDLAPAKDEPSVDEFSNFEKSSDLATTKDEPTTSQPEEVVYRCESCKKTITEDTCKSVKLAYNKNALYDKVKPSTLPHVYCLDCYKEITKEKAEQDKRQALANLNAKKEEAKAKLYKGLIRGGITAAIVFAVFFLSTLSNLSETILGTLLLTLGGMTIVSQICWGDVISNIFGFFCRSFKAPFGFIIELSLDGFLWYLTVKLFLWIILGLLSIAFFIFGLFATLFLSYFTFPFSLGKQIIAIKNIRV